MEQLAWNREQIKLPEMAYIKQVITNLVYAKNITREGEKPMPALRHTELLQQLLMLQNPSATIEEKERASKTCLQIQESFLEEGIYYVVGSPWHCTEGRLILFLGQGEAKDFLRRNDRTEEPVSKVSKAELDVQVSSLHQEKKLRGVKIYQKAPLGLSYTSEEFLGIVKLGVKAASPPTEKQKGVTPVAGQTIQWNKVAQMREALDTFKKEGRRKLDSQLACENAHTLIDYLMKENFLDAAQLARELGLVEEQIREFCRDVQAGDASLEFIAKLLKHFGLENYLLLYKAQSKEIKQAIRRADLDKYSLKKGSPSSPELFKLTNIQRGDYEVDNYKCYIYQATLKSEARPDLMKILISNPSPFNGLGPPCIVGNSYEIEGLEPVVLESENAMEAKTKKISKERLTMLSGEFPIVIQPEKIGRRSTLPDEVQYKRQEAVLTYLQKEFNCDRDEAIEKTKIIAEQEEVLDAVYNYTLSGKSALIAQPNKNGYHMKKLVTAMKYSVYDAAVLLVDLHDNEKKEETLMMLKTEEAQKNKKKS